MNLLKVSHFSKQFEIHQLERRIEVLLELSFDLSQGQFLMISGPNGSGKSTLLRCLFRTYFPSGGTAVYQSKHGPIDLARAADVDIAILRKEEIGFVTQFLRPRPRVPALDLVAEPLLALGVSYEIAAQKAGELLEEFQLKPELWMAYPTTFSGGEQQKVNLARALISPRRLLLLDEPTASLDSTARAALIARLVLQKAQGVAMIGVFHHPEDIQSMVDQEIVLGKADGILKFYETEDSYVVE